MQVPAKRTYSEFRDGQRLKAGDEALINDDQQLERDGRISLENSLVQDDIMKVDEGEGSPQNAQNPDLTQAVYEIMKLNEERRDSVKTNASEEVDGLKQILDACTYCERFNTDECDQEIFKR